MENKLAFYVTPNFGPHGASVSKYNPLCLPRPYTLSTYICSLKIHIYNSKKEEVTQVPVRQEWMNTKWHLHTMGNYSALKRKDILTHTPTWVNPEDSILSEMSQSQ